MNTTLLFLSLMVPGTFFLGLSDTLIRRVLRSKMVDSQFLIAFEFVGVAVVTSPFLFIAGIPEIKPEFWGAFIATTTLNVFAQWAWYAAFKKEEASLVSPFRLISPPLVILTGFLVLGEVPNLPGALGILVTIVGLWIFLKSEAKRGAIKLREVMRRPGVLLALWGGISFAISFPFDKRIVTASSPLFAVATGFLVVGLGNGIIWYLTATARGQKRLFGTRSEWKTIAILPVVHTIGTILAWTALSYSLAAYAASVKRLWSLWAVILSGAFLKEGNIARKLAATLIMLGGIALTVVFG